MANSRIKTRFSAEFSLAAFFNRHPVVYFGTFTLAENVTSKAEAERRFKPFKDLVKRRGGSFLCFWERQVRGAWHVHCLFTTYLDVLWLRPWMVARGWGQWMKIKRCERRTVHQGDKWGVDLSSVQGLMRYLVKYVTKSLTDDYGEKMRPFGGDRPSKACTVAFQWCPWENPCSYLWHLGRSLYRQMYGEFPDWREASLLIRMGAEDCDWWATDPWFIPP